MTALREAAQQLLGALDKSLYMNDYCGLEVSKHDQPDVTDAIENLRAALAEPVQEHDLSRCPKCNGPADNGHDREVPPNPYYCTKCMAEPVAWRWGYRSVTTGEMDWRGYVEIAAHPNLRSPAIIMEPLYTAPPQRPAEPVQETSAERTLKRMGYTDCGGQFWKPPLGTPAQRKPVQEPDDPERRCGGPGCDMKCCQPVQEPVAYSEGRTLHWHEGKGVNDAQLFAAPPQRLPLTSDKDRPDQGATYVEGYGYVDTRVVRAIERAHKIREKE